MTPSKKTQKEAFQRKVGFRVDAKIPLFIVSEDLTEEGYNMLSQTLDGILFTGVQLVFVKPKKKVHAEFLLQKAEEFPTQVYVIGGSVEDKKRLYNISDVTFVFSQGKTACQAAWKAKSVPLTHLNKVVIDYNPVAEAGNGFIYEEGNIWSFYASFVRAIETYKFPYDWNTIVMGGNR